MISYVVTYRKRHTDKDTIHEEFRGMRNAEHYALMMFNGQNLDRVTVIEVDQELQSYTRVYLQERNCKHPNLQQEFLLDGSIRDKCVDCGGVVSIEVAEEEPCIK